MQLDFEPMWLTLQVATIVTLVLLIVSTPLAWWLAFGKSRLRPLVEAVVALPLLLPPTVLGFYLLVSFSPTGMFGAPWIALMGKPLAFSFVGLVFASTIYNIPFVVQPLKAAFEAFGRDPLEAAWSLRASPLDTFIHVAAPMALRGYLIAGVLCFAHAVGEFGVVLMVGGNIPGETRTLSIAIFNYVEQIRYLEAHIWAGSLLAFSFVALVLLYGTQPRSLQQRR